MYLSHDTIKALIDTKKIVIDPFNAEDIRPAGVRVHLGTKILVPRSGQVVSIKDSGYPLFDEKDITGGYTLHPGDFIHASIAETISVPNNILVILDGRSTIARLGLTTHVTASVLDGASSGPQKPVLEIKNLAPFSVVITAGDPIAMVLFAEVTEQISKQTEPQWWEKKTSTEA